MSDFKSDVANISSSGIQTNTHPIISTCIKEGSVLTGSVVTALNKATSPAHTTKGSDGPIFLTATHQRSASSPVSFTPLLEAAPKSPRPLHRGLSYEEELQSKVLQLGGIIRTWQHNWHEQKQNSLKSSQKLVQREKECIAIIENMKEVHEKKVKRLEDKINKLTTLNDELDAEKSNLEITFQNSIDKLKEEKRAIANKIRVTKGELHITRSRSRTQEDTINNLQEENTYLQVQNDRLTEEISELLSNSNNETNKVHQKSKQLEMENELYQMMIETSLHKLRYFEDFTHAGSPIPRVPRSPLHQRYVVKMDSDDPTLMSIESADEKRPSDTQSVGSSRSVESDKSDHTESGTESDKRLSSHSDSSFLSPISPDDDSAGCFSFSDRRSSSSQDDCSLPRSWESSPVARRFNFKISPMLMRKMRPFRPPLRKSYTVDDDRMIAKVKLRTLTEVHHDAEEVDNSNVNNKSNDTELLSDTEVTSSARDQDTSTQKSGFEHLCQRRNGIVTLPRLDNKQLKKQKTRDFTDIIKKLGISSLPDESDSKENLRHLFCRKKSRSYKDNNNL